MNRRIMGLSQAELAKKLHISRVTLGRYEADKQMIDMNIFLDMLKIFEISADTLLERKTNNVSLEELIFLKELRKEEDLYKQVMKYPRIEIQKLKNLY